MIRCGLQIIVGAGVFNVVNSMHESWLCEVMLQILFWSSVAVSLIDAGYFNIANPIPRRCDFFGHQLMQHIYWVFWLRLKLNHFNLSNRNA